ncbi:site-specific integrase [Streptomyces sp. SID13666]|nr:MULTISPECIES: tyrosine-type recombinase/integrase [unclassified Streptomyces]NEA55327.1 site-specific integrase [Streptomyces sp. SID13666]NEA73533.1 site-specific integrase [Streptomyces sp. SID13588]
MATVFQRCKSDPKVATYPCTKPRCGHSWTVRYREPGGRTARQREKTFDKKTGPNGADVFAARVESDKDEGLYIDPNAGKITVRAYAEDWLARRIIGESTYSNYKGFIDNHLIPRLGRKTLAGVSKSDIEHFKAGIARELAASTVYDRMKMVKHIFWSAKEEKRIREDPTKDVKNAPGNHAVDEDEIPTLPEVRLLHEHMSPQYKLTVWLQAGVGLRVSEALAFHVGCLRNDVIRVRWQISSKAHREDCKTRLVPLKHREEGEYRDVPAARFLCDEIDAHEGLWKPIPLIFQSAAGKTRQVEVFFAPRERGKGIMPTANTYSYHFRKACVAAGLVDAEGKPKYHPHSLRHFFASTALAAGIPIHEVSRWLGHKSIKTTVDIYGHLVPESWDRCRGIMQLALAEAT